MLRNHHKRMQPSLGPEASCPCTARQGNRIREPATPTRDAYLRPKSQSTRVYHTETKKRSGHSGSHQAPHITTEYSADIRNRTPWARVISTSRNRSLKQSLNIEIEKYGSCDRAVSIGQLRWQCWPSTKPMTLASLTVSF